MSVYCALISPGILDDEIKMVVWLDKVIDFAFIYSVIDDSAVQIRLRELGDARHSNAVEQIPFRTIQFQMLAQVYGANLNILNR